MNTKQLELIRLIDHALATAEQMGEIGQGEHLSTLIRALQTIKNQVVAGQLDSSKGISTLGLARGVADWIDALDSPLLRAVGAIEQYYQNQYD